MASMKQQPNRWPRRVMQTSSALDLEPQVLIEDSPRGVARSLKRSAEQSKRRNSEPFRLAMSMLNFFINRAGKNLPKERRERPEAAKDELRSLYGRPKQDDSPGKPRQTKRTHERARNDG